jgi:hypothetical protein
MWYVELKLKTKYVLGLPGGTQIGLEHGKLDGVGPVDNRPSTDKLHQFVQ